AAGTYNFHIHWGDSNSDTITAWNDAATTHTYASAGTYTIKIHGEIRGWNFANGGDRRKLLEVSAWGPLQLVDGADYFAGASNMVVTATDVLDLTGVTLLWGMFNGCTSLTSIPSINDWD